MEREWELRSFLSAEPLDKYFIGSALVDAADKSAGGNIELFVFRFAVDPMRISIALQLFSPR